MDSTAPSLEAFIASCRSKGLSIALISPTSPFLGAHLAEALLAQNIAVICETTLQATTVSATHYLQRNPHFYLVERNIENSDAENMAFYQQIQPQYIIFDLDETINQSKKLPNFSFIVTTKIKQLVETAKINKSTLLMLSMIDVKEYDPYLSPGQADPIEQTHLAHRREVKHFVETLLGEAMQDSQISVRILQYLDVYGPRMDLASQDDLSQLFKRIADNQHLTIRGDGLTPLRPIYITDFIYGVIKALFSKELSTNKFTLIHPQEMTLLDFSKSLQITLSAYGINADIVFVSAHDQTTYAKRTLYKDDDIKTLAWSPKVELAEGLVRTISFLLPNARPLVQSVPARQPAQALTTVALQVAPEESIVPYHHGTTIPHAKTAFTPATDSRTSIKSHEALPNLKSTKAKKPRFWGRRETHAVPSTYNQPGTKIINHRKKPFIYYSIFMVILLILFLTLPFIFTNLLERNINSNFRDLRAESVTPKQVQALQTDVGHVQTLLNLSELPYVILGKKIAFAEQKTALDILYNTLSSRQTAERSSQMLHGFIAKGSESSIATLSSINSELRVAGRAIDLASAYEKSVTPKNPLHQAVNDSKSFRSDTKSMIDQLYNVALFFGSLFQNKTQQTIALLIIDNNELRPAGGLVVGVLYVNVAPGKGTAVAGYEITDPKLATTIPSPQTAKTYLKTETLTLSNSLWHSRFSDSVGGYYNTIAALNQQPIAGIVGVDLSALKSLVSITGPIPVGAITDDNNKPITLSAENFTEEIAKLYAHPVYNTPDKLAKAEMEIAKAIITKLASDQFSFDILTARFKQLFLQKHLVFYSQDSQISALAKSQNWSEGQNPKANDFVALIDANISSNKVNMYVKRTIHQDVVISQNQDISERLVVTHYNESPSETLPFGVYKTFTNAYIPASYKIVRVTVDNKKPKDPIVQETKGQEQAIGTTLEIAPGKSATLTIEYQRPQPLQFVNGKATLAIEVQKQIGSEAIPYELAIQLPRGLKLDSSNMQFEQFSDGVLSKTMLDHSTLFNVVLSMP